jgi:hypothetical protein
VSLAFLAALATAPALLASARDDYDKGLGFVAAGKWEQARHAFENAIADKPKSSGRRGGYFPHYMLGVALQGGGSCRPALDAWAEEERQGEIRGEKPEADMHARQQGCRELLASLDQLAARIAAGAQEAQPQAAELARRATSSPIARDAVVAAGVDPTAAATQLTGIANAARTAAAAERRQQLEDLDASLAALRTKLRRALDNVVGAEEASRAAHDAAAAAAATLHRELKAVEPLLADAALAARSPDKVQRLGKLVKAANAALATAPAAELKRRTNELRALRVELSKAPPPPSPALAQAVSSFLHGDDAGTLALLAGLTPGGPAEAAHVCLLRGAALYDQSVAAARGDDAALDEARAALTGCPWREQGLTLSPRIFSPRFVMFAQSLEPAPSPSPAPSP